MADRFCCNGCCIAFFWCFLINLVVWFAFSVFIAWINVQTVKSGASCYVQNFYVPALNKSASNSTAFKDSIDFVFNFVNNQEYMGVYYDDINVTFYLGPNRSLAIANYTVDGFHQGQQDNTYSRDSVETRGVPWGNISGNGSSEVVFRVDLATAVRYKQWFFTGKRHRWRVGGAVAVNDTTGLKVRKKAIRLKSGAPELRRSSERVGPVAVLGVFLVLLFGM